MNKRFLKKIIAQVPEDLQLISALISEGKVKLSDIKYLPESKIFLLSIDRPINEEENSKGKINSIIKFEYIIKTPKSKNIDQKNQDLYTELLNIDSFKKEENYEITLLFKKNQFINLTVECIDVTLEDLKKIND